MNPIVWSPTPPNQQSSHLHNFIETLQQQYQLIFNNYTELHQWSIDHPDRFWQATWDFCGIYASTPANNIIIPNQPPYKTTWFDGAMLNFAENCLQFRDHHIALQCYNESGFIGSVTYQELFNKVASIAAFLLSIGIKKNDRIIGILHNGPEAIIAMLATTSIGAVWSSSSPDLGLTALADRFEQIEPKALFTCLKHQYQEKQHAHQDTIQALSKKITSIQNIITTDKEVTIKPDNTTPHYHYFPQLLLDHHTTSMTFTQLPFNHPLYILFSSGTSGKPKCLVHSAGGTLIQHLKELMLHTDLHREDTLCFYTTCSWMMWHWMVSGLCVGATLVLYDGSPTHPKIDNLFSLIDKSRITIMGLGAKLIELYSKNNKQPIKTHQLDSLKTLLTTGSPLLPESFDYIYTSIKPSLQVSSISGGSDIISCFALGNPLLPVRRGELQCKGLGMAVDIFDPNGHSIINQQGELVCTQAFPSMPIYLWNDPDYHQYHKTYFNQFDNTWRQGDYALITDNNGIIIQGRSDNTLNPGGIRIGSAEIYRHLEPIHEITDYLATSITTNGSEKIILFVTLKNQATLNDKLISLIKETLKTQASPHHVPAKIIAAPDLPRTLNGKISESVIKKILNHEKTTNEASLANPECLPFFYSLSISSY